MSQFRKTSPDDLYFVTLTVVGWIDVFTRTDYKNILVDNFSYCQKKEQLELFAYVIMPNHIHLIARRQDKDLNELLGRFKSYTAKKIIQAIETNPQESRKEWLLNLLQHFAAQNKQYRNFQFWQYRHHPTLLDSPEMVQQKIEYIHLNPVRAVIVTEPESYVFSSACPDSPLAIMEV